MLQLGELYTNLNSSVYPPISMCAVWKGVAGLTIVLWLQKGQMGGLGTMTYHEHSLNRQSGFWLPFLALDLILVFV